MTFLEKIKALINKVYRLDTFVTVLLTPIGAYLTTLNSKITALRNNFFFDTLDAEGCTHFEKLLKIPAKDDDTLTNRRAKIQAKWLSNNHNDIILIQRVCDSWRGGEIEANFLSGKLEIKFLRKYGIPEDIDALKSAINEVKPAHIPTTYSYKWPAFRVNCARINKMCIFPYAEYASEYEDISPEDEENEF